jgi:L-lysine epsilon oxidase C-terminal domain/L-Lysine epsilon oxidase N-terminal
VGPLSVNGGDTAAVAHFQIDRKNKVNDGSKLKITTLGELRSDNDGHLIVIGGMGRSDFDPGLGNSSIGHFANNDCWFDDVSDGPVDATLTIDGVAHPVSGAWVAVGPPDFVPAIRSYRTLYDSLIDVIVREMEIPADDGLFAGPLAHIAEMNHDWKQNNTIHAFRPSFTRDIAPILRAISRIDRVHRRDIGPMAQYHGVLSDANFNSLGGPGSLAATRLSVFERLRDPNTFETTPMPAIQPSRMPLAYGDYYEPANGGGGDTDPAYLHSLSKLQYALLAAWNRGNFIEDWGQIPASAPAITPEGLDRAALENMSGGAFYPGMEVSWLFTKKQVWERPFRLARNKTVGSIPVPGSNRRDLVVEAGTFSQQMAVPWQADFNDCAFGEDVVDPTSPTGFRRVGWWPTNRPDEVFPEASPNVRAPWARLADGTPFPGGPLAGHKAMVDFWSTLGFVVETTPAGAPKNIYEVEFNKRVPRPPAPDLVAQGPRTPGTEPTGGATIG